MEFRKEDIQVLRTKSRATSQVTLDMDYNVPDVKPDIGRMIQNKGEVTVEEVRLNDGHAFVKGKLQADVLYVGEEDGRVYNLSAGLPVEETLNLDGIVNGDKLCLKWEIEDLSIHIIHSRKLNIRAVITFYASVDELTGIRLPVAADDENISVKKKQMCLLSLAVHKKDTLRLKEEIELVSNKPDIAELLWYTIEVRGLDLRPEEQKIKAKGELFIFVLYTGGDEGSTLQWLEHTIPFNGEVECTGCTSEMIPNLEASVISQSLEVRPDADGEERKLQADVVLELDMNGGSESSVTARVKIQENEDCVLYVTETDADGNPVEGAKGFAYNVSYKGNTTVTLNESNLKATVRIINKEKPKDKDKDKDKEEENKKTTTTTTNTTTNTTTSRSVKTGDNTPIGIFVVLLIAAIAVIGGGICLKRRKK